MKLAYLSFHGDGSPDSEFPGVWEEFRSEHNSPNALEVGHI